MLRGVILATILMSSVPGPASTAAPAPSYVDYGRRMIADQCKVQPTLLWCNQALRFTKTLSEDEIRKISQLAKSKFIYTDDVTDSWRSHSSAVQNNLEWRGDCDDLVATTFDLLIRSGQPMSKMWFVLVNTENKDVVDHIVGMVRDDQGFYWIVGDTGVPFYPVGQLTWKVLTVARVDQMTWKEVPKFKEVYR